MFRIGNNLRNLALSSFLGFFALSMIVSIIPATNIQKTQPLESMEPLDYGQKEGLKIYVRENCMACHTQQVRSIEMDKMWGDRPSLASDFYYSKKRQDIWRQSPSLLGSERTGPDLTNVGKRQADIGWHMLHLYNPRLVVKESIMPAYPWMFEEKEEFLLKEEDVVLNVPKEMLKNKNAKVVAKADAVYLVQYLLSLKQADLPEPGSVEFIPSTRVEKAAAGDASKDGLPDGEILYKNTCSACHQPGGDGLPGAFPSLKNSPIVKNQNFFQHVNVVLNGYNANPNYGAMPPQGENLSDAEIAAIVNYEREHFGEGAQPVTEADVKQIRDSLSK
ncbi:MAG: cbb3-type cytochrome c oxidase subunit II [Flavobacteriaceae bacterium]|nr:cbb3-type cytochrome c oxidase subunit II [Flavobacteriaceae bacterium]